MARVLLVTQATPTTYYLANLFNYRFLGKNMRSVLVAGILIVAGFLVVLSFIPLGIEPLTELYFENHAGLRANIFHSTLYNFSFTIHNLEYQGMAYNYTVGAFDVEGNLIKAIDRGRITLGDNESRTVFEEYNLAKGFGRARVEVLIEKDDLGVVPEFKTKLWWPDPNYPTKIDIHFWVDEVVPVTITRI